MPIAPRFWHTVAHAAIMNITLSAWCKATRLLIQSGVTKTESSSSSERERVRERERKRRRRKTWADATSFSALVTLIVNCLPSGCSSVKVASPLTHFNALSLFFLHLPCMGSVRQFVASIHLSYFRVVVSGEKGHTGRSQRQQPLPQTQLQTGPRFVDAVLSLTHVLKSPFSGCWIAGFISISSKPPQSYEGETKVVYIRTESLIHCLWSTHMTLCWNRIGKNEVEGTRKARSRTQSCIQVLKREP